MTKKMLTLPQRVLSGIKIVKRGAVVRVELIVEDRYQVAALAHARLSRSPCLGMLVGRRTDQPAAAVVIAGGTIL